MTKIYLLIYNKETHYQYFKYFDTIKEKDKYKRKIKYVDNLLLIEDSEDLEYIGDEVEYEE